jgi:small conductance mechanosensitive channel
MGMSFNAGHFDALADMGLSWATAFLPRLVAAILILVAGTIVSRWAARLTNRAILDTRRIDDTARPAITAIVRYSVLILAIVAALSQIGVQTASLLAVLGAAGLAIGLALQGTLANIASGIMLLWLRPFRIGDYIEVVSGNAFNGTIKEIGLFACQLESYDGIFVFAPNSTIWNFALRNHSRNVGRLVSLSVKLPRGADIGHARDLLASLAREDDRVLERPMPDVFIDNLSEEGAVLTMRFWAAHEAVGEVQRTILERIGRRLEEGGPALKPSRVFPHHPAGLGSVAPDVGGLAGSPGRPQVDCSRGRIEPRYGRAMKAACDRRGADASAKASGLMRCQ